MASTCTLFPNPIRLSGRALKIIQPNFSVAIRLTDEALTKELPKLYDHVYREHPTFRKHLVRPEKMFVQVASMHLGTQASLDAACGVLKDCNDLVGKHLSTRPVLRFKGLSSYDSGSVVNANCCDIPTELLLLVRELRLRFWSLGYVASAAAMPPRIPYFEDNKIPCGSELLASGGRLSSWHPRITMMRVRGADLSRKRREATASFKSATKHNGGVIVKDGIARKLTLSDFYGIPPSTYQNFERFDFGSQAVERFDLLSTIQSNGPVRSYPSFAHLELNV